MELKRYQKEILEEIGRFARTYALTHNAETAYNTFMSSAGLTPGKNGIARYTDDLNGVPKVCVKVPTGGGKTFIGVCAIDALSEILPSHDDVVVWLVPRKEILAQTLRNFRNPNHFLRMRLDQDFAGSVEVLDKEDGLRGRGFNVSTVGDQLTLFVLSYDSFKNKDGRRAYAENSSLAGLTAYQQDTGTAVDVEGADDTALISALAGTNPIVIVDESHHARSKLSLDMLRNLNPRFMLELTATPDSKHANVIAQASARALKREEMVKLPVVVYRRPDKRTTIADAVTLQRRLEVIAQQDEKRTGRYIRPIVLFQAERRGTDNAETFLKLKQKLVESRIPDEQIAVRTGDVDELKDTDLTSRSCPIRFIITVEALAEGWDCPFAYILATVANKNSQVSVEQIVGRVLRQPYATRASARCLNIAYVLTASADFDKTLQQVVDGLNGVGFSQEDVADGGVPRLPKTNSLLNPPRKSMRMETKSNRMASTGSTLRSPIFLPWMATRAASMDAARLRQTRLLKSLKNSKSALRRKLTMPVIFRPSALEASPLCTACAQRQRTRRRRFVFRSSSFALTEGSSPITKCGSLSIAMTC